MERTIWTPRFYGEYDFEVYLDWDFAREMIQSRISTERQTKMNKLGDVELKRLGVNWLSPYTFHEDSRFITQFYIGQNGVWLATDHQTIDGLLNQEEESSNVIKYTSHNVDTPKQAYVLMMLFGKWVEYVDALKGD